LDTLKFDFTDYINLLVRRCEKNITTSYFSILNMSKMDKTHIYLLILQIKFLKHLNTVKIVFKGINSELIKIFLLKLDKFKY
jgi:hypothetical protein